MQAEVVAYAFLTFWTLFWSSSTSELHLQGLDCNEEHTNSYGYKRFHKVNDIADITNDGFRLNFKVKAESNAHVLFTENAYLRQRDMSYEIVIGSNRNSNSDIRRGRGTSSKQRVNTPNYLSSKESRGFWIDINKDGRIFIGKENDKMPFLMWKDTSPLNIRFISFTSWREVRAKWWYNCIGYKEEDENKEEVITPSKPMTWTEKLHNDLLADYDKYIAPQPRSDTESNRTVVFVHLSCRHVELDEKRSTLDLNGILSMSWTDENLQWSPVDYGNVTSTVLQVWDIWVPDLMLYNYAAPENMDFWYGLQEAGMIVSHEGTVFWSPNAHFKAFCENIDMTKWPKDTQTCELRLGFWSQQHLLQLSLWENTTYLDDDRIETEWKVTEVGAETVWIRTPWANTAEELGLDIPLLEDGTDLVDPEATDDSGEPEIVVHSSMALRLTLVRRNSAYNTVLLIPLAMILTFTLLSFWAFPLGPVKLALQCLSLVTVTLFLLITWRILPTHAAHVPSIISAYQTAMTLICISIVATVIIINFTRYPPVRNLPSLIKQVLISEWITTLFFLPTNGEQVNQKYNSLDESQSKEGPNKDDELDFQWSWILLSTVIDRTMFFIYSILFFYIFSAFG